MCVCVCHSVRSYDISTIASVIPAFASRQDLLVIDDGASYPIQQVGAVTCAGRNSSLVCVCVSMVLQT